jgi:hypothetical protein
MMDYCEVEDLELPAGGLAALIRAPKQRIRLTAGNGQVRPHS